MDRNTESRFSDFPGTPDLQRSKFSRNFSHKTTFNTGDLIPIFCKLDVMPGDTWELDSAGAVRMSTPIFPVMDNAYLDTYFYYIPYRLVWEHWREFMGENRQTAWEQPTEYLIPQIKAPKGGWEKGTIADYFGLPTNVDNIEVSALPFRGYVMCWNEFFRDQNLKDAAMVNLDDTTVTGSNSGDYVINAQLGAKPLKAAKYHDYFTSCLPQAQKGPAVLLPLGSTAQIIGTDEIGIRTDLETDLVGKKLAFYHQDDRGSTFKSTMINIENNEAMHDNTSIGLAADLRNATAATINELRLAFAVQKFYEKSALGGSRYREIVKSFYNVNIPDARVQIPEYLGGSRYEINIDQVIQTSATGITPQGNAGAYSLTNYVHSDFTKSFTEHGMIIGLAVVRTENTYQQGIERMWSAKDKFDFYWPVFANIGNTAVLNKEIYAQGNSEDEEVFGYQEAWRNYRYSPSYVTSSFRSNYSGTLDSWHYAQNYTELPHLSSDWIDQGKENVDRTIAVTSELEDQFIADFYFKLDCVRPMPMFSVPGLIDHH